MSEMVQRVAWVLIKECAAFYGDRVPDSFDDTLSKKLARAAIAAVRDMLPAGISRTILDEALK